MFRCPRPWRKIKPMRYTVVLQQEPDGGYLVSVPAMPGCVTQGETREEAMTNIIEAARLYLEDVLSSGEPVPREAETSYLEVAVPA